MTDLVSLSKQNAVALITVNNPPVNALSIGVPEGILACLEDANQDPGIKVIVIHGAGRSFIAGADIKELGTKPRAVRRPQDFFEDNPKVVIAAIHGYALGGGLEFAMGCHYRVASASSQLGLPEVKLGIIPGAGGTQRLPRLVGPDLALDMMTSGNFISAQDGLEAGLIDYVVADDLDLISEVIHIAKSLSGKIRRTKDRIPKLKGSEGKAALFARYKTRIEKTARNERAPWAVLEAVDAAINSDFVTGLQREADIFDSLVNGEQAKSLRYAFMAERAVKKVPDLPKGVLTESINNGAVIGGGTMGAGICMAFANAGIPIFLLEQDHDSLKQAMNKIEGLWEASVKKGRLSQKTYQERLALITPVVDYETIGQVDIVIEAVYEDLALKKSIFTKLDQVMKPGAILATNSSALDINEIASACSRPDFVVGTHFFSPAHIMKLLEIVRGNKTASHVVARVLKLGHALKKNGVVCGNCNGFVANRSRIPFATELNVLLEQGATPGQIDRIMKEFGYPMGPFAVFDLAGGDVSYAVRKKRYDTNPNTRKLPIADRLYELERYGQKTGGGWFDYKSGNRSPYDSPAVAKVIDQVRAEKGIVPIKFNDDEILKRILFSSVNEICNILGEGVAYRASDVDVMWLSGFGYPRYRGGVMYWANQFGSRAVYDQVCEWHETMGGHWQPSDYLKKLAANNAPFVD